MNDYLNVITKNYVNFSGRARRREYWMFILINIVISFVLGLIDGLLFNRNGDGSGVPILSGLYGLAVLLPSLAVTVRRLHDTGRSGWWILLGLIPLVGSIVLLIFDVQDSQPMPNKWGPNPKATEQAAMRAEANW